MHFNPAIKVLVNGAILSTMCLRPFTGSAFATKPTLSAKQEEPGIPIPVIPYKPPERQINQLPLKERLVLLCANAINPQTRLVENASSDEIFLRAAEAVSRLIPSLSLSQEYVDFESIKRLVAAAYKACQDQGGRLAITLRLASDTRNASQFFLLLHAEQLGHIDREGRYNLNTSSGSPLGRLVREVDYRLGLTNGEERVLNRYRQRPQQPQQQSVPAQSIPIPKYNIRFVCVQGTNTLDIPPNRQLNRIITTALLRGYLSNANSANRALEAVRKNCQQRQGGSFRFAVGCQNPLTGPVSGNFINFTLDLNRITAQASPPVRSLTLCRR
jgi:hypothetical protein